MTTIRRRIDQLGLREPVIEPYGQGDNEIIVELAGEGDPTEAKTIISRPVDNWKFGWSKIRILTRRRRKHWRRTTVCFLQTQS